LALQARVTELEAEHERLAEIEERLDFAERLLARQRDPERLA
jgi:tetrahydromethanopterin S-methyltransferase subunit G